jgi:hypothetical protein
MPNLHDYNKFRDALDRLIKSINSGDQLNSADLICVGQHLTTVSASLDDDDTYTNTYLQGVYDGYQTARKHTVEEMEADMPRINKYHQTLDQFEKQARRNKEG